MHVPAGETVRRKVSAYWQDIRVEADIEGSAAIIVQADTLARSMSAFQERVYEQGLVMASFDLVSARQHETLCS